jgi:hypothetical protein
MVECLPSKCEALSSNPSAAKINKGNWRCGSSGASIKHYVQTQDTESVSILCLAQGRHCIVNTTVSVNISITVSMKDP